MHTYASSAYGWVSSFFLPNRGQNRDGEFFSDVTQRADVVPRDVRHRGESLAFRRGLHQLQSGAEIRPRDVHVGEAGCAERKDLNEGANERMSE